MAKKKANSKNFKQVMQNIITKFEESDKDEKVFWCEELNIWLDEMKNNDAFGTEGQLDPRGDQR